jgi:hypothetical protein
MESRFTQLEGVGIEEGLGRTEVGTDLDLSLE